MNKHTDRHTDRRTFRLIESIGPEGRCFEKRTIVRAQEVHDSALQLNCVGGEMPTFPDHHWDKEKAKLTEKIKTSVKARVSKDSMDKQHVHLQTLLKQGQALKFLYVQQQDPTWRGYLYNLKKGKMKFILNSSIHTLPTINNLKLWNKTSVVFVETETAHITASQTARYPWIKNVIHGGMTNKCSEMITKKIVFHGLCVNSRRSAKLNTVTKFKTKNTDSELKFCCKNKCVSHENQGVTHGETILWTKPYITYCIVSKCMSLNSSYQKVIYKVLTLRRKNADPDKRCCF